MLAKKKKTKNLKKKASISGNHPYKSNGPRYKDQKTFAHKNDYREKSFKLNQTLGQTHKYTGHNTTSEFLLHRNVDSSKLALIP